MSAKKVTFEQQLARLEEIVAALEKGDAPLADSLALFEDGTQMIAVVKTDGYGHGAKEIAGCIESLPYLWGFAVATVDEAMVLRKNGIKKPILILGITFPNQFEQMICEDIRPAVCDYGMTCSLLKTVPSKIENS